MIFENNRAIYVPYFCGENFDMVITHIRRHGHGEPTPHIRRHARDTDAGGMPITRQHGRGGMPRTPCAATRMRHGRDTDATRARHGRDTGAGVYAAYAATRPPNLFRRSAATFCRIVFYDLAAARRYTLGGRVDT